ncbi:MAG: hypothetical protein OXN95_01470 [bacterium]|nr:hypothetical protein [bacterium]MDE2823532.1 hypothetical protein [Chloroflexota bacterium]
MEFEPVDSDVAYFIAALAQGVADIDSLREDGRLEMTSAGIAGVMLGRVEQVWEAEPELEAKFRSMGGVFFQALIDGIKANKQARESRD